MVEVDIQKFKKQLYDCKTGADLNKLWTVEENESMAGKSLLH
jgi:hypothetical protein